jgi:hypothetical protein
MAAPAGACGSGCGAPGTAATVRAHREPGGMASRANGARLLWCQSTPSRWIQGGVVADAAGGFDLGVAAAPGGSSTGSCSMTKPTNSHKAWTDKGGHVTSTLRVETPLTQASIITAYKA